MKKSELLHKLQEIEGDPEIILAQVSHCASDMPYSWAGYVGDILEVSYEDFTTEYEGIQKRIVIINDQYNE